MLADVAEPLVAAMVNEDLCEAGQSIGIGFAAGHVGAGEIDGPVAVSAGELVDLRTSPGGLTSRKPRLSATVA